MLKALVIGLASLIAPPGLAAGIIGTADKVVDGDTLWVCDQAACHKIRVCGIDAPELRHPGGSEARRALIVLIEGRSIRCTPVGEGTVCDGRSKRWNGDRLVAQCFVGEVDVGAALISSGNACEWIKFSGGHYSQLPGRAACGR
jgi:endonuclease YncB( thermonuclease family)